MSFQDIVSGQPPTQPSRTPEKHTRRPRPHLEIPRQISSPRKESGRSEVPRRHVSAAGTPEKLLRAVPQSRFGRLSEEIQNLQDMVRQLEILVRQCGESPENQWRSRILLQSAGESDRDLGVKIREYRMTLGSVKDRAVRASRGKLIRDYERAHMTFVSLSSEYLQRQLHTVSQFSGGESNITPEEFQARVVARQQEDFFERAMRERAEELSDINRSMHRVTEIYSELGNIVEAQQEAVDIVAERIENAKWNARAGLGHLELVNLRFCGAITDFADDEKRSPPPQTPPRMTWNRHSAAATKPEEFRWSLPFETIGDDMMEVVNKDIMSLGKDIVSSSRSRLNSAHGVILRCSAPPIDEARLDEPAI